MPMACVGLGSGLGLQQARWCDYDPAAKSYSLCPAHTSLSDWSVGGMGWLVGLLASGLVGWVVSLLVWWWTFI